MGGLNGGILFLANLYIYKLFQVSSEKKKKKQMLNIFC